MGFSLKKLLAGSVTAAVIAASAITGGISSASSANRITISPSDTVVSPGDTFDVMVAFEPGSDGVAAFTVDLRYDSDKLEVYNPTQEELENKYNVSSKFNYVSYNYKFSSDAVRITGYSANNVKTKSNLALVTFKVKDTAKDSFGFWINKDTVTTVSSDGNLKEASCTVPTKSSVIKVNVKSSEPVVTTSKTTTTSTHETTKVPSVNAPPAVSSSGSSAVTTAPVTSGRPEQSVSSSVTINPQGGSSVVTTTPGSDNTISEPGDSENSSGDDVTSGEEIKEESQPLFSYKYEGEGDFTETDDANYSFYLGDYISDFDVAYNLDIHVCATGGVNGAIGYNNSDGVWETVEYRFTEAGEAVWSVSNLVLDENHDLVVIPIYYMANGAEFTVEAIEVTPVETTDNEVELGTDDNSQPSDSVEGETNTADAGEDSEDEAPQMNSADASDRVPDTGSFPIILLAVLPFAMIGTTVATIIRIRKKIK